MANLRVIRRSDRSLAATSGAARTQAGNDAQIGGLNLNRRNYPSLRERTAVAYPTPQQLTAIRSVLHALRATPDNADRGVQKTIVMRGLMQVKHFVDDDVLE